MTYRQVKSVPGLEVTADAEFRYKGKPKKVIYCTTVNGRKATARMMIMIQGKSHYWQAAKLVAEASLVMRMATTSHTRMGTFTTSKPTT